MNPRAGRAPLALLCAFGAALLLLLTVAASPASAHAELVATTPANGAALDRAPDNVTVQLSEGVQAVPDGLRVLDSEGARVDVGDTAALPGRPDTIAVGIAPGTGEGAYTVSWRATSADSHPVHGAFTFTVGSADLAQAPLPGSDQDADPVLDVLVAIARGAGYVGLALLVGAIGMLLLAADGTDRRQLNRSAVGGGLLVITAACGALIAQGPYAAGAGPASLLDPDLLRPTLTGRLGIALEIRIVLTGLVLALPAMDRLRPVTSWPSAPRRSAPGGVAAVTLVAVAATYSASGHAAGGRWIPVALPADVLHLLAMGVWLGGLAALIRLYVRRGDDAEAVPLTATTRRFSPVAAWCVGALVVTGVFQAQRQLGGPANLLSTGYGRLLVIKVLAVLAVLALAYRARRWIRTRSASGPDDRASTVSPDDPTGTVPPDGTTDTAPSPAMSLHTMRRTLVLEAAGGAVILVLSTLLAGSVPPHGAGATVVATAPVRMTADYDTGGADGSGTATARIVRKAGGAAELELRLTDPAGQPVSPEEVTAAWSLPALGLGPLPATLEAEGPGRWNGTMQLSPAGDWRLAVTVRTTDVDTATVAFEPIAIDGGAVKGNP